MHPVQRPRQPFVRRTLALLTLAGVAACGGGGGGASGRTLPPGTMVQREDGTAFLVDPHVSGLSNRLVLEEITWGRLVDVHDVGPEGRPSAVPLFRDLVIHDTLLTDNVDYVVETNPVTYDARLIILRERGAPDAGTGTFESLLRDATRNLPPVIAKSDDGTSPEPFSVVARNGALQLRFSDLLADDAEAEKRLGEMVRLQQGYPPITPYEGRMRFSPNHGDLVGDEFHSTRVVIDMTISETEAARSASTLDVNVVGLPRSRTDIGGPNLSIRVPTEVKTSVGQFVILRGLNGAPVSSTANGPTSTSNGTLDVVRAFRSGNDLDLNEGFLLDFEPPELIGGWEIRIDAAREAPAPTGDRFEVDLTFDGPCRGVLDDGDILQVGTRFMTVTERSGPVDPFGVVTNVQVRALAGDFPPTAVGLLGTGFFLTPYSPSFAVAPGCWINVIPEPGVRPASIVAPDSRVLFRFSEPLKPESIRSLDTLRLIRGGLDTEGVARNIVVGDLFPSRDMRQYTWLPVLPLDNQGSGLYHFDIVSDLFGGIRDFAGNPLASGIQKIEMLVDRSAAPVSNGGLALRFSSPDELEPIGARDFRGQAIWDPDDEVLRARPVNFSTAACDEKTGTVQAMIPFPPGVQTPLSPFGSRLHAVWRYADFGWGVFDSTRYNIDVTGLSWRLVGTSVLADFYPDFAIVLGHSKFLPDEGGTGFSGPRYAASGLSDGSIPFDENFLEDPRGNKKVVHRKDLGYRIRPTDVYQNGNGIKMMPYPLNRGGGPLSTYTWRDTAILAKGAPNGAGVPMEVEVGAPLFAAQASGTLAPPSMVPSVGLPLLWEIRCFPSATGIGLNPLHIRLAYPFWPTPNFRCYSTGGTDTSGKAVFRNPSTQTFPMGGFNPMSRPPGRPTARPSDNSFYLGQLDYVTRISRTITMWIQTGLGESVFYDPIVEPDPSELPERTSIVYEYRGARAFSGTNGAHLDAERMDFYGNLKSGFVSFRNNDNTWKDDVADIEGAKFFQVRMTFISDLQSLARPELDSFGMIYEAR
jgi:hypothetical protein